MSDLDLGDLAARKVSTLSGGQRRRLDVALGLAHRPGLLFLDEPSTGLDPQSRAHLWQHILRLRSELGMTLVLTTHYLDEAGSMAERVVVVDHGTVIADDTAAQVDVEHVRISRGVARGAVVLSELLRGLDLAGIPASTADLVRPTLDDVFLALTGRSLREGADLTAAEPARAATDPSEVAA